MNNQHRNYCKCKDKNQGHSKMSKCKKIPANNLKFLVSAVLILVMYSITNLDSEMSKCKKKKKKTSQHNINTIRVN